jgi:hypothetical protein
MKRLAILLIALPLGGCGVAAGFNRLNAQTDYQASSASYKACLAERPPQACEGLRLAMEADDRKYNSFSAGLHRTDTLTILNR